MFAGSAGAGLDAGGSTTSLRASSAVRRLPSHRPPSPATTATAAVPKAQPRKLRLCSPRTATRHGFPPLLLRPSPGRSAPLGGVRFGVRRPQTCDGGEVEEAEQDEQRRSAADQGREDGQPGRVVPGHRGGYADGGEDADARVTPAAVAACPDADQRRENGQDQPGPHEKCDFVVNPENRDGDLLHRLRNRIHDHPNRPRSAGLTAGRSKRPPTRLHPVLPPPQRHLRARLDPSTPWRKSAPWKPKKFLRSGDQRDIDRYISRRLEIEAENLREGQRHVGDRALDHAVEDEQARRFRPWPGRCPRTSRPRAYRAAAFGRRGW